MTFNSILRAMVLPLIAFAASIAAPAARAIPMDYAVTYSGSSVGSAFGGAFSWDSQTSVFTNFTWDLAATSDRLMAANWRSLTFGGTMGQFLFEILTGDDVHPSACNASTRCTFTSANVRSDAIDSVEFRTLGAGATEYIFRLGSSILYSGVLSVAKLAAPPPPPPPVVLAVSEPFTLLLLGAGLLSLAWVRRRAS